MKFIIAFLCFLSLCIDVFANDSYSLRYGTDEYSFNLTSRVDDLKVYDFIVNRGRCRSGWSVDKTVSNKTIYATIWRSNEGIKFISGSNFYDPKISQNINSLFCDLTNECLSTVELGFGDTKQYRVDCRAIEIIVVTNHGEYTHTLD